MFVLQCFLCSLKVVHMEDTRRDTYSCIPLFCVLFELSHTHKCTRRLTSKVSLLWCLPHSIFAYNVFEVDISTYVYVCTYVHGFIPIDVQCTFMFWCTTVVSSMWYDGDIHSPPLPCGISSYFYSNLISLLYLMFYTLTPCPP